MNATNKLQEKLKEVGRLSHPGISTPPATMTTPATPPPAPPSAAGRQTRRMGERWEDAHRRATFHLHVDQLAALHDFAARTGRNKSEVVRAAIAEYLRGK